jgi:hypothetical protein
MNTITKLINRLIKAFSETEMTTICVGKLNFLSKSPRDTIEFNDRLVVSVKNCHNTMANSKATAK